MFPRSSCDSWILWQDRSCSNCTWKECAERRQKCYDHTVNPGRARGRHFPWHARRGEGIPHQIPQWGWWKKRHHAAAEAGSQGVLIWVKIQDLWAWTGGIQNVLSLANLCLPSRFLAFGVQNWWSTFVMIASALDLMAGELSPQSRISARQNLHGGITGNLLVQATGRQPVTRLSTGSLSRTGLLACGGGLVQNWNGTAS